MPNYPNPIFVIADDAYNTLGAVEVTAGRFVGRDTTGRILFDRKDYTGALTAVKKFGRAVAAGYYGVAITGEGRGPHPCAPCNMRRTMADAADRAARKAAGCPHDVKGWCQTCGDAEREARRQREAATPIVAGACACVGSQAGAPASARKLRGAGPVACCGGHRDRCLIGHAHIWAVWYENGRLARTADTYRCDRCQGVCTAEEPAEPAPFVSRWAVLAGGV